MKVLSLFSGIGAFEKALDRLKVKYDLAGYCEIDKYASKSYAAIHNVSESMNLGDITKVDERTLPKDIDLITYGFPCQDISNAGKMKGLFNEDGTQTRSGLFFEALRIIEATKPRVAIAENVKNLTGKRFEEQFRIVLESLESAGYNNYWKVLNAKDYGIPQNRERVFIVSIRKNIDSGMFRFPEGFKLEHRLKDVLEDEVDEKYYLSDRLLNYICATGTKNFSYEPEIDLEIARPLTSSMHKSHRASTDNYVSESFLKNDIKVEIRGGKPYISAGENTKREEGKGQKILVRDGGNRMPKIFVREATKKGYAEAVEGDSINFEQPNSKTRRGRVGKQIAQTLNTSPLQAVAVAMRGRYNENGKVEQHIEVSDREVANTITTVQKDSLLGEQSEAVLRIRKLTPRECFRLMGFEDSDFEKAEAVNSNTQLYKQAGNSIGVPVLEHIIQALLDCHALEK